MQLGSVRAASLAALLGALAAHPAPAQEPPAGEWAVRPAQRAEAQADLAADVPADAPIMHVALRTPGLNTFYVPLDRLEGLTREQVAAAQAPVHFRLRRDAGTFSFDGTFRGGRGTGRFDFTPDPAFADSLARRGMQRPTAQQQFSLARHGVDLDFLDELEAQGYARPSTRELDEAGVNGASVRELREMGALGYHLGTLAALMRLHVNGVQPQFIRELAARGHRGLSADELLELRMQGDTPAAPARTSATPLDGRWILAPAPDAGLRLELQWSDDTQWRRAIEPSELSGLADRDRTSPASVPVAFRMAQDAGTFEFEGTFRAGRGAGSFRFRPDRDFAATLRSLGVDSARDVSDHQLKNLAFGGISAAAVREFQALGFAPLTLSQLLDLAVFHVTPDYVRAMRAAGVRETKTVDQVVDLRFHDLTPAFVRCVRDAGYRDAAPDALLEMRRRGAPAC